MSYHLNPPPPFPLLVPLPPLQNYSLPTLPFFQATQLPDSLDDPNIPFPLTPRPPPVSLLPSLQERLVWNQRLRQITRQHLLHAFELSSALQKTQHIEYGAIISLPNPNLDDAIPSSNHAPSPSPSPPSRNPIQPKKTPPNHHHHEHKPDTDTDTASKHTIYPALKLLIHDADSFLPPHSSSSSPPSSPPVPRGHLLRLKKSILNLRKFVRSPAAAPAPAPASNDTVPENLQLREGEGWEGGLGGGKIKTVFKLGNFSYPLPRQVVQDGRGRRRGSGREIRVVELLE